MVSLVPGLILCVFFPKIAQFSHNFYILLLSINITILFLQNGYYSHLMCAFKYSMCTLRSTNKNTFYITLFLCSWWDFLQLILSLLHYVKNLVQEYSTTAHQHQTRADESALGLRGKWSYSPQMKKKCVREEKQNIFTRKSCKQAWWRIKLTLVVGGEIIMIIELMIICRKINWKRPFYSSAFSPKCHVVDENIQMLTEKGIKAALCLLVMYSQYVNTHRTKYSE